MPDGAPACADANKWVVPLFLFLLRGSAEVGSGSFQRMPVIDLGVGGAVVLASMGSIPNSCRKLGSEKVVNCVASLRCWPGCCDGCISLIEDEGACIPAIVNNHNNSPKAQGMIPQLCIVAIV